MEAVLPSTAQGLLRIIALISLAAIASSVSKLALSPSFGAIPSTVNHQQNSIIAFLTGCILHSIFRQSARSSSSVSKFRVAWVFWIPCAQQVLSRYNGQLGPEYGSMLHSTLFCYLLIVTCAYNAASSMRRMALTANLGNAAGDIVLSSIALALFWQSERLLDGHVQTIARSVQVVPMQLIQAGLHSVIGPTPNFVFILPAVLQIALFNPRYSLKKVNASLNKHDWSILDRAWSNTGYISVIENHAEGYRVLRCDHSLLGGEWTLTAERQEKEGWTVNEPTYAVFEMLEAIRLIKRKTFVPDSEAQALVIGLGIGTAPKALITHGINTTIVELDQIVYDFAKKYFALPTTHTAVIQDAVSWVEEAAAAQVESKVLYDYIIHDVFTGGASPLALFNAQFLRNLRTLLKSDGLVAINYAGDLSLSLTQHILNTIEEVFDNARQCRIFRDAAPLDSSPSSSSSSRKDENRQEDAEDANTKAKSRRYSAAAKSDSADFVNMIVFCRNDAEGGSIAFRKPVRADYLGSRSRQHYLMPRDEYEISFPGVRTRKDDDGDSDRDEDRKRSSVEILNAGDEHLWADQQLESAIRHWYIMREVVPDAVWELW